MSRVLGEAVKAVKTQTQSLPVLIPVPSNEKCDGTAYVEGAWRAIRLIRVRLGVMPTEEKIMKQFKQHFGSPSREDVRVLMRLLVLSQAVRAKTSAVRFGILKRSYVPLTVHGQLPQCSPEATAQVEEEVWNDVLSPGGSIVERLCAELNEYLQGARPTVWWNERLRRLDAGLLCDTAREALFATYLLRIAMPEGIGFCENEKCGNMFTRHRREQKFCSKTCGNYVRKMRQLGKLTISESR